LLCKAKFSAENAPGVGKQTTANILNDQSERFLVFDDDLQEIRNVWEKNKPPDIPPEAREVVKSVIKASIKKYKKRKVKKSRSRGKRVKTTVQEQKEEKT
jgi:hypothetical protein